MAITLQYMFSKTNTKQCSQADYSNYLMRYRIILPQGPSINRKCQNSSSGVASRFTILHSRRIAQHLQTSLQMSTQKKRSITQCGVLLCPQMPSNQIILSHMEHDFPEALFC